MPVFNNKFMKPAAKTHLIERYFAKAGMVLCDCGWEDKVELFHPHRKASGAIRDPKKGH